MPQNARSCPPKRWSKIAGACGMLLFGVASDVGAGQSQAPLSVSAYVVVTGSIAATLSQAPPTRFVGETSLPPEITSTAPQGDGAAALRANGDSAQASSSMSDRSTDDNARTVCATIAVSCSGATPMRINVDGNAESTPVDQCGPRTSSAPQSVSLCGSQAPDSNSIGVMVEY